MNTLALDDLLRRALLEDIGFGDITSEAIFPEDHRSQGFFLAKQQLVLAGMQVFSQVFALLDQRVEIKFNYGDGAIVSPGETIASIAGYWQGKESPLICCSECRESQHIPDAMWKL
jgi:nicotinate-nucleotide pyrophosphorylase (carboxylating)